MTRILLIALAVMLFVGAGGFTIDYLTISDAQSRGIMDGE